MADVATTQDAPLAGLSPRERVDYLRRQMAAIPAITREQAPARDLVPVVDETSRRFASTATESARLLPVAASLAEMLPRGGLARGTVVSMTGARSVMVGILASVTGAGGHAAIVDQPGLGLLAAVEMGADLEKCAMIPHAGPAALDVAAVLLDGMDLVILGLSGTAVAPTRARGLIARARSKQSVLIVTDGRWDGADVRIDSRVIGYSGIEAGHGRVSRIDIGVEVSGRGFRPRTGRMELGTASGVSQGTAWRTIASAPQLLSDAL